MQCEAVGTLSYNQLVDLLISSGDAAPEATTAPNPEEPAPPTPLTRVRCVLIVRACGVLGKRVCSRLLP
jgi:hypothetical protein